VEMVYESDGCSFEASPVNFCDEKHLVTYKDALNTICCCPCPNGLLTTSVQWSP
jgi:hypothetical protein